MLNDNPSIEKLRWIMEQLRDPETGCPWDIKQTFTSITPYTIEEAYEVAEAIEKKDYKELQKELGDLLFQVVFYSQLGQEQSLFEFDHIVEQICEKLIRRHPHVFSDQSFANEQQVNANWEQEKAKERAEANAKNLSVMDDIPLALPALSRAYKMQKRAASIGFDWPDVSGALDKVEEEIAEIKAELTRHSELQTNISAIADELGDLYFALTNVTRHLGLKPEQIVNKANQKFEIRFRLVEKMAQQQDKNVSEMTLNELDMLWEKAKKTLNQSNPTEL